MMKKIKILVFIKPFWKRLAKHKVKFDMIKAFEEYANIFYWYNDGDIEQILKNLLENHNFKPDFIFLYDNSLIDLAPTISGLNKIAIPKGYLIIDVYWPTKKQVKIQFIEDNKIDLIFSVTKEAFLNVFPQYKSKFRWLPFSINPHVFKDWQLIKNIDCLLMGLINFPSKNTYPFRKTVLEVMRNKEGFVYHQHPGHTVNYEEKAFVNEKYAKEINRSKIFFTCGSKYYYPVLKFFEVPACRTLLLAEPNQDILELGFEDGVNFVACNQFNFEEKAIYYLKNEKERKRITDNGYHLIHTNHTNRVRALQFINYVKDYIEK
ncbi:glycosyltransferase family protein [Metabacillus sp. Hm71]|uniref:glycosyltransferase family protein n=1 Tax=Metabacillus sp. Hm71 TaxID=3450743 RepID=UPI003F42400D